MPIVAHYSAVQGSKPIVAQCSAAVGRISATPWDISPAIGLIKPVISKPNSKPMTAQSRHYIE
jgi:hypothetical protein